MAAMRPWFTMLSRLRDCYKQILWWVSNCPSSVISNKVCEWGWLAMVSPNKFVIIVSSVFWKYLYLIIRGRPELKTFLLMRWHLITVWPQTSIITTSNEKKSYETNQHFCNPLPPVTRRYSISYVKMSLILDGPLRIYYSYIMLEENSFLIRLYKIPVILGGKPV